MSWFRRKRVQKIVESVKTEHVVNKTARVVHLDKDHYLVDEEDANSLLLTIAMKAGASGLSYNANREIDERSVFTIFDGDADHVWYGADDLEVLQKAWKEVKEW